MMFCHLKANMWQLLLVINSNLGFISHRFWHTGTATYSLKLYIKDCGQTAADEDMVTIDSLYINSPAPLSMVVGTIADPLWLTV